MTFVYIIFHILQEQSILKAADLLQDRKNTDRLRVLTGLISALTERFSFVFLFLSRLYLDPEYARRIAVSPLLNVTSLLSVSDPYYEIRV